MDEYFTFVLGFFIALCLAISFLGIVFLIFIYCYKKIESNNDIEMQYSQQSL